VKENVVAKNKKPETKLAQTELEAKPAGLTTATKVEKPVEENIDAVAKAPVVQQAKTPAKIADTTSVASQPQESKNDFFANAELLFSKYIINGKVNYSAAKNDISLLNTLADQISNFNIHAVGKNTRKAFFLNAYNIIVIISVAENYPVKSLEDIKGFFDLQHAIAGEHLTLKEIEKSKIRNEYNDPRINFWLVPASQGSPAINSQPVKMYNLDEVLDEQVKAGVNNNNFIRVDKDHKEVLLPMMFKLNENDFNHDGKTVLDFVNQYRKKKISPDYKISYYDSNRDLNDSNEKLKTKETKPVVKPSETISDGQPQFKDTIAALTVRSSYEISLVKPTKTDTVVQKSISKTEIKSSDTISNLLPVKHDTIAVHKPVIKALDSLALAKHSKADTVFLPLVVVNKQLSANDFFTNAELFFSKYVSNQKVNYGAVKKDTALLNTLSRQIESFNSRIAGRYARKAFYIDAYNILVVKAVADAYPVQSPRDIKGFFDAQQHAIAGEQLTLNEIEDQKISNEYNDPRIDFWLTPAAKGSPGISNHALMLHNLDELLDEQVKDAINNNAFVQVNNERKEILLPLIFKFNEGDFARDGKTILDFINEYRKKKITSEYKITYYDFNWDINDTKEKIKAFEPNTEIKFSDSLTSANPAIVDTIPIQAIPISPFDTTKFKIPNLISEDLLSDGSNFLQTVFQVRAIGSLNTQHAAYNIDLNRINSDYRSSNFNLAIQCWNRITPRINFGVQFSFRSLLISSFNSSPYEALTFSNNDNAKVYFRDVTNALKYLFYDGKFRLAGQTSFLVPVSKSNVVSYGNNAIYDNGQTQWINQIFYIRRYSKYFTLNAELNGNLRFNVASSANRFMLRGSFVPEFNYWFSRTFRFYAFSELNPQLNHGIFSSFYFREGVGITLLSEKNFQFDFQYYYYALGKKTSASSSFIVGSRLNF
jgi:hypothetical protein